MNIENNTTDNLNSMPDQVDLERKRKIEEKLLKEEEIGEHDIVIDEDFQINLQVADVEDTAMATVPIQNNNEEVQLGSEQTGNITF